MPFGAQIIIESSAICYGRRNAWRAPRPPSPWWWQSVKKVIITSNDDITIVLGVTKMEYNPKKYHVISGGARRPSAVWQPTETDMNDTYGVRRAVMTTYPFYTTDQKNLPTYPR